MLIALIDDGVDTSLFPQANLRYDLSVKRDGTIIKRDDQERILTDHGTTSARIITLYAPDAEFCSLRIFDEGTLRSTCSNLVAALEWCFSAKIPIVHMSVGTKLLCDYSRVRSIIAKMIRQNQVIIAAYSNKDSWAIPACLSGVIGVVADPEMKGNEHGFLNAPPYIGAFYASSRHLLSSDFGTMYETQITNSYAAPTITARVHNEISKYMPLSLPVPQVSQMITNGPEGIVKERPDFIARAYILNPSHQPILKHHLFFDCVDEVVSWNELRNCGKPVHDIVYIPTGDPIHEDIHKLLIADRNMYNNLLYCGLLPHHLALSEKMIWDESKIQLGACLANFAANNVGCPIVSIDSYGTKSLDLLCTLGKKFLDDGYQCVRLSDYPYAYLYGVEYVPSMTPLNEAIQYAIQRFDPDVIICNMQSPHDISSHNPNEYVIVIPDETRVKVNNDQKVIPPPHQIWNTNDDISTLYQEILAHCN